MRRLARDAQRSRVYAWERQASLTLPFWNGLAAQVRVNAVPTFQTLEECRQFMDPIWRSERGRYGRAKVAAPVIERPHRGQRRGLAFTSKITLPRWTRNPWYILHEMAHCLTPADQAHGPRFVGVLIGLLSRHLGYETSALMESADVAGVKYNVRSIGSVPAPTLSERLLRVLPVTEMDAAIALDVSWRQVRGASIRLISTKQARWLRGRLVPLPLCGAPKTSPTTRPSI